MISKEIKKYNVMENIEITESICQTKPGREVFSL